VGELRDLLTRFSLRDAAADDLIERSEDQLATHLPGEYKEFLKVGNGGEGFIGESEYAIFWGVDELYSLNESYEVATYAPGFLVFGTDGGGEAYGFDTRVEGWPIVRLPFIGMSWNEAIPLGNSFCGFLERLYRSE